MSRKSQFDSKMSASEKVAQECLWVLFFKSLLFCNVKIAKILGVNSKKLLILWAK